LKNYSEFHDGFFDGLMLDDSVSHIFVSTPQKKRFVIRAQNVASLTAGEFKEGNIIFDVLIRSSDEVTLEDIQAVYSHFSGVDASIQAQRALEKARENGLSLLEIGSSYGATCLLLARSFELCGHREWIERYMLTE
jgi:hypothetical protein